MSMRRAPPGFPRYRDVCCQGRFNPVSRSPSDQMPLPLYAPGASEDEPLVPARMVNEWVYCPRLAYLEWVEGAWADNADTSQGRRVHSRGRQSGPPLPDPKETIESFASRKVMLASETLGLIAEIDVLDAEDGALIPVDTKKGKRPHVDKGAYDPERVQVAIQGILLREAGYRCDEGALFFTESRERVRIVLDDDLVAKALAAASELRLAAAARRIPPPLENSPKCPRCSLLPICLPDEVNLFRSGAAPRTPPPAADSALPLYVQQPGARIGKKGEELTIVADGEPDRTIPIDDISELVVVGPVSLSTPAVQELSRRDIPIAWMSSGFWLNATTGGKGPRSAAARQAQYSFAGDVARSRAFARELVAAKLRNQRTILRRNWRGEDAEREERLSALKSVIERIDRATETSELLGLEGEGAAIYFRGFPRLLTPAAASFPEFDFTRRSRRPPADPVNACLSLVYAILTRTVATTLEIAGLDPWKGLYHVERPGRPSLALDLMEPMRPILADSAVLTAINNGELTPDDFIVSGQGCALKPPGRRKLISAYERRLDQEAAHPTFGYQISMRRMLHVQARLLAKYLKGEIPAYPHYVPR
jgi:CRISPR-associated endonuclease Cas1/CRISPR-associated protein Cas4